MVKKIDHKIDLQRIANEWDQVVDKRNIEIKKGNDKSLIYILSPEIEKRVQELSVKNSGLVVDCGCGSGYITSKIAPYCGKIIGIDISKRSIAIAQKEYRTNENIEYQVDSIEEFGRNYIACADICIANMVLSNIIDCKKACSAIWRMLKEHGRLLVTLPHPCFWPEYWGYDQQEWFDYTEQICISGDFCITGVGNLGITTHIHRPLEMYIGMLAETGFSIVRVKELYSKMNQGQNNFKKPRFMFIEAEK